MEQELIKYLRTYITPRRQELFNKVLSLRTNHFTVATEDVYQMHNTSAVMRSCEAFGIQELHVVEERLGKRVDREIAMGSQKWVNLKRYNQIQPCLDHLKNVGYQIIATSPHNNDCTLHQFDISKKSAFCFGKEKEGLSDVVLERADGFITIPTYGFTESLNISVSVAIILQSVMTRIRESNVSWQLSETEKIEVELQWLKKTIKSSDEIIKRYYGHSIN